jgi:hypothetical protein
MCQIFYHSIPYDTYGIIFIFNKFHMTHMEFVKILHYFEITYDSNYDQNGFSKSDWADNQQNQ